MFESLKRRLGTFLITSGFDPRLVFNSAKFLIRYVWDVVFFLLKKKKTEHQFKFTILPVLSDRYFSSGVAKGHYFHQDLWAAKKIFSNNPVSHADVGSRVDGFIAHLLVFRDVDVFDVRPLTSKVDGLNFKQLNIADDSINVDVLYDSLSCLHALEHFGLGRYGDSIDPDGWYKALHNFSKIVKNNGTLYLSVPIGVECIEFNAQRIFSVMTIIKSAHNFGFVLKSFSYVDDLGSFYENGSINLAEQCKYGCGCFEFIKNES